MKINLYLLLLIVIIFTACNSDENPETLDWLVGDWKRTNEQADKETFESWEKVNENLYTAIGYTLNKNQDTIWKEKIRLIKTQNEWDFEVTGSKDIEPTVFKLTSIDTAMFICENKENEFPKKIEYKRGGNEIKAVISGDGKQIPFDFEKFETNN